MRETWNTPTIEELDTKMTANTFGFGDSEDVYVAGLRDEMESDGLSHEENALLKILEALTVQSS